jgi:hypothetical protein
MCGSIFGLITIGASHVLLELDGSTDGIDGTRELDQRAVAYQFDYASTVAMQRRLKASDPKCPQPRDRAALVTPHQAGVAGNVCAKNRRQAALFLGHGVPSASTKGL